MRLRRQSLTPLTLSLLILSLPILPGAAAAQAPQTRQESEEEKARARRELERKALVMLDETLALTQTLKLAENRAYVRAQAADMLWKRDEKRARSLFREAAADLAAAQGAEGARRERSFWMLAQLRSQVLYTAATRDAQFALELLRDSRPAAADGSDASDAAAAADGDAETELRLEQALTAQMAESDPKAALRAAEESLSKGVTFGVLGVLERLRRKDGEVASQLAVKIVEKLRGQTLSGGREAFSVGASLLNMVLLPQNTEQYVYSPYQAPAQARGAERPKPLVLEDGVVRELAELLVGAALKDSNATGVYGLMMTMRPLLSELEKRVPARAAQLRQRMAEIDRLLDPRARAWMQFDSVMSKPADALLEAAAKAPDEMRMQLYSAAAYKMLKAGDAERARQVAAEHLRGEDREQMLAAIEQSELARAVEKGGSGEAREVASRIKSKERRARALAELAVAFALKGDRKSAAQLLEEARGLVDAQPDSDKEVEALLDVARAYALVDTARTFELIDPLVGQANDMLTAAALLEKFGQGGGVFRKGEMLVWLGLSQADGTYARHVKALTELARVDFDRTKAVADRFNRDEVRLAARLTIARSILSDRLVELPDTRFGGAGAVAAPRVLSQ